MLTFLRVRRAGFLVSVASNGLNTVSVAVAALCALSVGAEASALLVVSTVSAVASSVSVVTAFLRVRRTVFFGAGSAAFSGTSTFSELGSKADSVADSEAEAVAVAFLRVRRTVFFTGSAGLALSTPVASVDSAVVLEL